MNIELLISRTRRMLRQKGLRATILKAGSFLFRRNTVDEFDARYGTSTGGLVPAWRLDISSPNVAFGEGYQATLENELLDAIDFVGEDPGGFVFVDLGCGKGRTLLVAAKAGFKTVVGVEFARALADTARENLKIADVRNGDVIHSDAAEFLFPSGNLVIYLYNPFNEIVLKKVLQNIRNTYAGRVFIIYKVPQPACIALLDQCECFERFGRVPTHTFIYVWRLLGTSKN